jgi:hypothetical protein
MRPLNCGFRLRFQARSRDRPLFFLRPSGQSSSNKLHCRHLSCLTSKFIKIQVIVEDRRERERSTKEFGACTMPLWYYADIFDVALIF